MNVTYFERGNFFKYNLGVFCTFQNVNFIYFRKESQLKKQKKWQEHQLQQHGGSAPGVASTMLCLTI